MPPDGYDEPSVSPLRSSLPENLNSGLPSSPKAKKVLCTWPVIPMRTPPVPSGWNQWVKTEAPRSPAHSMIAFATESAVCGEVVHEESSRRPAGSPCFARYASASAPLKQCLP